MKKIVNSTSKKLATQNDESKNRENKIEASKIAIFFRLKINFALFPIKIKSIPLFKSASYFSISRGSSIPSPSSEVALSVYPCIFRINKIRVQMWPMKHRETYLRLTHHFA